MTIETLPNGIELLQTDSVLKLGLDAILLADFANPPDGSAMCDLGAGAGAVSMLMARRNLRITAVEFFPPAFDLLQQNIEHNNLADTVTPLYCDLRRLPASLNGKFGAVVCNPPYLRSDGTETQSPERSDATAPPEDVCAAASKLLQNGGRLYLVVRPDRLADYIYEMRNNNLEPKRLCLSAHTTASAPSLALIEARKGGGHGLTVEPLHVTQ